MDRDIRAALRRGELVVSDLDPSMVRPAAVSLRLGREAYALSSRQAVDAADAATYPDVTRRPVDEHGRVVLHPGKVLLARTGRDDE